MKLLVVNVNTTASMTDTIVESARSAAARVNRGHEANAHYRRGVGGATLIAISAAIANHHQRGGRLRSLPWFLLSAPDRSLRVQV
jgi:hypothetical protein